MTVRSAVGLLREPRFRVMAMAAAVAQEAWEVREEHKGLEAPQNAALVGTPQLLFRSTALGDSHGRVAAVPLSDPNAEPAISPLQCERVAYAADHVVGTRRPPCS